ncbi:HAMP domain-containing sensor histidine kinase [Massilia sp. W12]|uniref:sensor histidine kinase n=1 Tax=Massilia sp. W12 TaxID=3126507 RepID=UPI0030CC7D2B
MDGADEELTREEPELFMFLASTAHDMKNSISVLCCTLERLLVDQAGKDAQSYPQMAHMLYEAKRLNNNLIQLLALYKEVGKPGYPYDPQGIWLGDFVELVQAQNKVLLASKHITLEIDIDPGQDWYFDEDLILGVVSHAINNAVHYTKDQILLLMRIQGEELEIRVEDNGEGYPPGMLERGNAALCGRAQGVSFANNSTGLGLYFSSEVAKMHKNRGRSGSVRLENGGRLGGGCFVLRLP